MSQRQRRTKLTVESRCVDGLSAAAEPIAAPDPAPMLGFRELWLSVRAGQMGWSLGGELLAAAAGVAFVNGYPHVAHDDRWVVESIESRREQHFFLYVPQLPPG